jgi:hypothetical protein
MMNENTAQTSRGHDSGSERQSEASRLTAELSVFDVHMRTCVKCGTWGGRACAEGKWLHARQSNAEMESRWIVSRMPRAAEMPKCAPLQHSGEYYYIPHTAQIFNGLHFTAEKDAISAACKLRVAEIDRLTTELNALYDRIDAIEKAEMESSK